jgi:DNA-binding CsgD family transcriptional regulator
MSPAELGKRLGISEDGVTSLVSHLAREGKVRICLVEPAA